MRRAAAFVAACALLPPALAGVPEAVKLLQQNRAAEARVELERSAAGGDVPAQGLLAMFYWAGYDGRPDEKKACMVAGPPAAAGESLAEAVLARCYLLGTLGPVDRGKARALSRTSALAGNHEGGLVYYQTVFSDPALSYRVDGKADRARYDALAARPPEARKSEIEALDILARGANVGHRGSQVALAGWLIDNLGEGNRAKARMILSRIVGPSAQTYQLLDAVKEADAIAAESRATIRVLHEAQQIAVTGALALAYPPAEGRKADCKDIQFRSARAIGPVQGAAYLPFTHPFLQHSYLVRGSWEEDWGYSVCGKEVVVRMHFDADGLSGARFAAR